MNVVTKTNLKRAILSCSTLFRYATSLDFFLMVIALLACLLKATVHVMSTVVYSEMVAMLVDRNLSVGTSSKTYTLHVFGGGKILVNATRQENMAELRNDAMSFGIVLTLIAATMFITGMIHVDLMNVVGLRIVTKIKREFFKATLRKDIGWHDLASNQNFAVRITDNIEKVREGISEKLGQCVATCITAVVMIVVSFVFGWKLTLAISIYIPIVLLCNYVLAKHQSKLTVRELDSYVNAGNLVEEVLGAVDTVKAFGGEKQESDRYEDLLIPARDASKWRGVFSGVEESISKSTLFFASSTAFWFGSQLILNDRNKVDQEYTPAVLMIALFGLLVGAELISKCTPFLDAFATARSSAASIFEVIDSTTKIDPLSLEGKILSKGLRGDIEFRNVFFKYPAREGVLILREFNLQIQAGQTVALVGHSGCGKSTCLQMLQRFYDPISGCISLDGIDMRLYNLSWLRSNIAIVGQEPVLFQATIGENIKLGNPEATQKEVEDAAKAADVHDFIMKLPKRYDTRTNERGLKLSVGQKRQIAIARALIQNPKILLLDESTSYLDYHSERLVQKSLDAAAQGRTTIVVPHRLSAIRCADRIVFMHEGKIAEDGSHEDLMAMRGKYFDMVTTQEGDKKDVTEDDGLKKEMYFFKDESFSEQPKSKLNISNSATMETEFGKNEAAGDQTPFLKTFIRILRVARQEWYLLILGTMCAVIYGCAQPVFAFLFAEFYVALAQIDPDTVLKRTSVLTVICLIAGLAAGAVCFFQTYLFISSGVRLTTRLRSLTFRAILEQDIAWFEKIENSVGTLSARLSGDAANIQGAIGYPLSEIIQAIANFVCCLMLAFYFSWHMALACLCTSPFMIASVVFEAKYMSSSAIIEKRILEETSRIATEAIANIRTVAELRLEPQLIEDYNKELEQYEAQLRKRLRFRGMINASGWSIMFFGYAIALTYGGHLCSEGKIEFQNIIKVSESLLYGLMILALALAFTPSFTTALIAGHRLFQIMDETPRIQSPYCYENSVMNENFSPSSNEQDLNELSQTIPQEKTVALESASVFGNSTYFNLLLKFYDLESSKISIDAPHHQLGIVSQEPALFDRTIAENIAYGDNTRQVSMTEIIEASIIANAHGFITSLPNGYDTKLGARGKQLSTGQKQRIAIARTLLRNSQVLVLDKATFPLGPDRERVEQTASDFVSACIMSGGQIVK